MIVIRKEETDDVDAVRAMTEGAFGQPDEARIIDRLRANCDRILSLVGTQDGRVVGHILFSPVTIDSSGGVIEGMGLGPMAVLPENQREGIGSALVEHGLAILRRNGCPFVV
ncbi:MAG: N-acetyltransferase, partial [bacterium]